MGLGSARGVPLARAREKAAEARALLADKTDPLAAKRANADREAPFFVDFAEQLIATKKVEWKNEKHEDQWFYVLSCRRGSDGKLTDDGFCRSLRSLRVNEITTEHVLNVLKPIWSEKPETATRLRSRLEIVLDGARAAGFRVGDNPARWKGHLDRLLPRRKRLSRGHHKALPYNDVPALMSKLRTASGASNRALEFLILTATRSGETMGAGWKEVDFSAATWTIPAERMKSGREHVVPLGARALELLREMQTIDGGDFVFASRTRGRLSANALLKALRDITGNSDSTPHGFRSSFRDWIGDCTGFSRELAEAALAHVVADRTEAAYRRLSAIEKRRDLMRAWEKFLSGSNFSNVVTFEKSREHLDAAETS
jgi:integrase